MQDKPSAEELLEALAAFLEQTAIPALAGRERFHAIVGANVARMVARELRLVPVQAQREYDALCSLLGETPASKGATHEELLRLNAELCRRISRGDADAGEFRRRLLAFLREIVAAKLEVANPKMLA